MADGFEKTRPAIPKASWELLSPASIAEACAIGRIA
jgi:hypothetical protein